MAICTTCASPLLDPAVRGCELILRNGGETLFLLACDAPSDFDPAVPADWTAALAADQLKVVSKVTISVAAPEIPTIKIATCSPAVPNLSKQVTTLTVTDFNADILTSADKKFWKDVVSRGLGWRYVGVISCEGEISLYDNATITGGFVSPGDGNPDSHVLTVTNEGVLLDDIIDPAVVAAILA